MEEEVVERKRLEGLVRQAQETLESGIEERTVRLRDANRLLEERVTERTDQLRKSEQQAREQLDELETLYATAPVGLAVMSSDLRCIRINDVLAAADGLSAAEHIGRTLQEIAPELAPHLTSLYRRVIETGEPVLNREFRGPSHAEPGSERDWLQSFHPLKSNDNTVRAVSVVVQDITELKRAQTNLRRAERLVSLGTFAAGVAHEINNPVGAIGIAAEAAIRAEGMPNAPENVRQCLELIVEQARRCGRITRSILQFAKCESAEKKPENLHDVIEYALGLCRTYAEERGAVLRVDGCDDLPPVMMNRVQMELIFTNLIRNGIESVEPGGRVTIRAEAIGDGVRAIVEDEGEGITVRDKAKLFDPFFSTRQKQGGTGLGLSIAHGIVEEHGGSIKVENQPERGARFIIELPVGSLASGASGEPLATALNIDDRPEL